MMNDLLKDDLEAMENAMCKLAPRADIWQDRLIYAMCLECGTVHDVKSNFCPNCGADMREES